MLDHQINCTMQFNGILLLVFNLNMSSLGRWQRIILSLLYVLQPIYVLHVLWGKWLQSLCSYYFFFKLNLLSTWLFFLMFFLVISVAKLKKDWIKEMGDFYYMYQHFEIWFNYSLINIYQLKVSLSKYLMFLSTLSQYILLQVHVYYVIFQISLNKFLRGKRLERWF